MPRFARLFLLLGAWLAVGTSVRAGDPAAEELFEREVRPIFTTTCLKCHGPEKQEGDLRLDSRDGLLRGGVTGPAIVSGKPEMSLLVQAIRQTDDDLKMPPKAKLTDPQIAAVARWIELGAPWPATPVAQPQAWAAAKNHWAFQPVRDPEVPQRGATAANPIDAFIQAKLAEAKLNSSPPADRRTLIRRVTYDLTGLPPSPEEVEAFVRDDDPEAYEKLVERLLASPHYGEQWGRHWLDVARYSDTKGYVYAREQRFWVHAWAYRDWVVQALNNDMPYDRFLMLQIAADQAAREEPSQLAAMGFLTLGRRFLGVTHDIIDDRIDVVTRGALGLTVSCARCHDHKYDPIPTRDYYSLYGVFQNCEERLVPIAEPEKNEAYLAFEAELKKRQQKFADLLAKRRDEWGARVRQRAGDYLAAQLELHKYPAEGFDVVLAHDDIIPAFVRRWESYLAEAEKNKDPVFVPWQALAKLPPEEFRDRVPAVFEELSKRPAGEVNPLVLREFTMHPASMQEVAQRYGALFARVDAQWREAQQQTPPPAALEDDAAEQLRQVLYGKHAPCVVPAEGMVHIEGYFDLAACEELWRVSGEVDNWLIQQPLAPAHAAILVDRENLVTPHVFKRGRPTAKGEAVPRQFLALLAGEQRNPFQHGSGRLELAQAIVDPQNPLTARVIVNRVWHHHFGAGLVTTPSDFGTRATPPSHPELLDWLATRFVAEGWKLKSLHRRILLSQAYRQGSTGPADAAARAQAQQVDPANRLLWRMNPRRLSFEELRDSLFAASGELDLTRGGKPAEMFQPGFRRRTLYGLVDRQFLPGTLRIFDFANPDLHIPQRSDTTVPQQALFFLNDELLLRQAKALAARTSSGAPEERVQQLFHRVYQRAPSEKQRRAALALVAAAESAPAAQPPKTAADWQYGFGAYDEQTDRVSTFTKLPHFTGESWQGGAAWPDAKLGWVKLTAEGGHAGNDRAHAAIRRWTAPRAMKISLRSSVVHDTNIGDGVHAAIVSSRHGRLAQETAHNGKKELNAGDLELQAGDTLDFVVDIGGTLNNDQFVWDATITAAGDENAPWRSSHDFHGPRTAQLTGWEQLAQVLLAANEFVFVD